MNAQLQVYVAKPVYSDQLKNKKQQQNTMALVLEPDWHIYSAPSNETVIWATLTSGSGDKNGWVPELDTGKRGRPKRRERMEAQASRRIRPGGRTPRTSPFSRARPAARPLSARAAAFGCPDPGRVCDCCFAAFLTGRPLLTGPQLRAANPRLVSLLSRGGQFRVALLRQHPGRRRVPAR